MPATHQSPRFAALPGAALLAIGLTVCYLLGQSGGPRRSAQADVTETPRREAFQAGGVLNEPTLKEISATLKRIEAKMDRFQRDGVSPATPSATKRPLPGGKGK
jgi:hypothetical protein